MFWFGRSAESSAPLRLLLCRRPPRLREAAMRKSASTLKSTSKYRKLRPHAWGPAAPGTRGGYSAGGLIGATRALALLFGTLWLASCVVGPNYKQPNVPTAEKFAGAASAAYSAEEGVSRFWTQF